MSRKEKTGTAKMLAITGIVIAVSIALVRVLGAAMEKRLLSGPLPSEKTIAIGDSYLQIAYPWEASGDALREADEEEEKQFRESEYAVQLEKLAALFGAALDTEIFQVDENGWIIHKGTQDKELSYAVDPENGIAGFGTQPEKETDDKAKKEKREELQVLFDDPVQEIYRLVPALNDIWMRGEIPVLGGLRENQENSLSITYEDIQNLPRQILYCQDVLTVILSFEETYLVLQYAPSTQKYSSCLVCG